MLKPNKRFKTESLFIGESKIEQMCFRMNLIVLRDDVFLIFVLRFVFNLIHCFKYPSWLYINCLLLSERFLKFTKNMLFKILCDIISYLSGQFNTLKEYHLT